jgi:hypothetical protein
MSTRRQKSRENQTTKGTEMEALTKAIKDIFRPVHVRGKNVPPLNRLTLGSVTAEQQGNKAIARRHELRRNRKFSFPNGGTCLELPAAKEIPAQEKRKEYTW